MNNNGRRGFTCKALDDSDLLTLNKQDLYKVDVEYEEVVAEMFHHANARLKRTLKIKEESETFFLKKEVSENYFNNQNSKLRRMSTSMSYVRK